MARSERQNQKRTERRKLLRDLGFSPKAAARIRDLSSSRIEAAIKVQKENVESVPRKERSDSDKQILRKFRSVPLTNNPRVLTFEQKRDQWSEWSSKSGNFPADIRSKVLAFNDSVGENENHSFGYQAAYFEYVEERDDVDDGDFYERNR